MKRLSLLLVVLVILAFPLTASALELNEPWYGGEWQTADGQTVMCIVESYKSHPDTPDYSAYPFVTVKYVKYSLNQLEEARAGLSALLDEKNENALTLPSFGFDLSVEQNAVIVYIVSPSERNIAAISAVVPDPSLIIFKQAFPDKDDVLYDDDDAGSYIENGKRIYCVPKAYKADYEGRDDVRFVDYSTNQLIAQIDSLAAIASKDFQPFLDCSFNNIWVDVKKNRVMIDMDYPTQENIAQFKANISDSPMVAFTSTLNPANQDRDVLEGTSQPQL